MKNPVSVKLSVSPGNTKMGAIPSVSLPPVITCAAGCKCAAKCYAAKLCRLRPSVRNAYQRNFDILQASAADYWRQVKSAMLPARYFRLHVSGDIVDAAYMRDMCDTVAAVPETRVLVFTKQYQLVNDYVAAGGTIPANMHLVFSAWPGMEMHNPHNFPTANVIFKNQAPDPTWLICGGNCTECACQGVGCWQLKPGQAIAFYEH